MLQWRCAVVFIQGAIVGNLVLAAAQSLFWRRVCPSRSLQNEPVHLDRDGGQRAVAGGDAVFCRRRPFALYRLAQPGHCAGRHHGGHVPELPAAGGAARAGPVCHRDAQRAALHPAGHRGAGAHLQAVGAERLARGGEGRQPGDEPVFAHRRAAGDRPHARGGHSGLAAVAYLAHARAGDGGGADLPADGQLRARLWHGGHAGGSGQPDGLAGPARHAADWPEPGGGADDDVLRHLAGQPGVQAGGGQAGAAHRAAPGADEHGAAGHIDDVRAAQPVADARDAQVVRGAVRGRDF